MTRAHRAFHAIVLVGLLAHCAPADSPSKGAGSVAGSPQAGERVVRMHITADPASLSLIGKSDLNSEIVAMRLSDALVQYDDQLVIRPLLAESWEVSEAERTITPKPDVGRSPGVKSRRDEGVRAAQAPETASTGQPRANHGQGPERLPERFPKRSGAKRCQHCCAPIPPKPRHGQPQKFCNPKCRKVAWLNRKATEETVSRGKDARS